MERTQSTGDVGSVPFFVWRVYPSAQYAFKYDTYGVDMEASHQWRPRPLRCDPIPWEYLAIGFQPTAPYGDDSRRLRMEHFQ